NFTGAVGEFSFKAQLNKDKVKANDGVNLTVTLTGKGNIKLVDPSKIDFPEDFETYDPKTTENISVGANGVSGTKTFDYLVIPRNEGDYKINQINFSYFDPVKKEYITIPSPEFNLHVDKGDNTPATVVGSSNRQEDLKVLGNDIRYIKTNKANLKPKDDYFFGSALFITCLIFPFLAFVGFIFVRRKSIEQNKDIVAVKSRKATKMARKRLSLAEQHLKSNNKEQFYIEIFKSLYGYISDKLNIPVADLNKEHIAETLKSKSVAEPTIQQLIKTLDNCEYARYAPSAVSGDLKNIYDNTVELITKIENEIK
ncbi:MAG: BatD family protein, partial [Bacteroidia bacterium]